MTASLLEAARAGDRHAFDRLFARVTPRLRWYIDVRMGPALAATVEADDVLQDTFAAAWSGLGRFEGRGQGSFLRWLFTVAENRLRALASANQAQRRDRRRHVAGGPADAALLLEKDPRTGPCTSAVRVETRSRLVQAMRSLTDDERSALLGRVVEGRALVDVAAELNRSESATRRLVAKAAARLGAKLNGQDAGSLAGGTQ